MSEPGPVARYSAQRLDRKWWLFAPAVAAVLAVVAGWLFASDTMLISPFFTTHPLMFALFGSLILYKKNPWPEHTHGVLEANQRGLFFEGEKVADHADIKNADVSGKAPGESVLRIKRQRRTELRFKLDDARTERAYLYALGFDTLQHAAEYRGASRIHASPGKLLLGMFLTMLALGALAVGAFAVGLQMAMPVVVFVVIAALMALQLWPTKIRVGADGVNVKWAGRERYFAASEIIAAQTSEVGFGKNRHQATVLLLSDGERYVIPMSQKNYGDDQHTSLQKRVQHIIDARGDGQSLGAQLQRRGRSASDWYKALRGAGNSVTGLRSAHIDTRELWQVVENVKSRVEERIAAAIALRERLTPEERPRLQRIAKATAEPRVRIALDRIADDTAAEEELIATLESAGSSSDTQQR